MNKLPISAIILTYNEEKNVEECLKSLQGWTSEILIVDSHSTDGTLEIAKRYTNKIFEHEFRTQAESFNWALENLPLSSEWIIRLDADEKVTPELRDELKEILPQISSDVTGLYVKRRVHFLRHWIKHGGYYPTWLLRIFRKGHARSEDRLMDEHIVVKEGICLRLSHDIIDDNKKDLSFWIEKHNRYATREMLAALSARECRKSKGLAVNASIRGSSVSRRRWLKENIYERLPLFIRPFLYFVYRYFLRLGFLDGKEGLIFHFLQGFWYRFLVDAKIYELQRRAKKEGKDISAVLRKLGTKK